MARYHPMPCVRMNHGRGERMKFSDLDIIAKIKKSIDACGYSEPTPIQEEAIPVALEGKDIQACAQTGTGKTAAFAIPMLQRIHDMKEFGTKEKGILGLVITPTRELALQIEESFKDYGKHTALKSFAIFGGVSQKPQEERLKKGVDILIATPGRLLDLMTQGVISLDSVEILVLDEADRMLDMGFLTEVKKILVKTKKEKQTLFFSATMPPEISRLASTILVKPVYIEVTPVATTVEKISQNLYLVDSENKKKLLLHILKDKTIESVLVFSRTKYGADKLVKMLNNAKVNAKAIHGDKSQSARVDALSQFKTKEVRVLVATDVAARGIDIDGLTHVINYDLPDVAETYVHRIGRTGRAGHEGVSITFCDIDEKDMLQEIERLINRKIEEVTENPFPMVNFEKSPKKAHGSHGNQGLGGNKKKMVMTKNGSLKEKRSSFRTPYVEKSEDGKKKTAAKKTYGKPKPFAGKGGAKKSTTSGQGRTGSSASRMRSTGGK